MTAETGRREGGQNEEDGRRTTLEDFIKSTRARLQIGGPPVSHSCLYAYIAGETEGEDRSVVERLIATYRAWHDMYWRIISEMEPCDG